jgi:hypothetical protein
VGLYERKYNLRLVESSSISPFLFCSCYISNQLERCRRGLRPEERGSGTYIVSNNDREAEKPSKQNFPPLSPCRSAGSSPSRFNMSQRCSYRTLNLCHPRAFPLTSIAGPRTTRKTRTDQMSLSLTVPRSGVGKGGFLGCGDSGNDLERDGT